MRAWKFKTMLPCGNLWKFMLLSRRFTELAERERMEKRKLLEVNSCANKIQRMWWISECRWWVFIEIHNREFAYLPFVAFTQATKFLFSISVLLSLACNSIFCLFFRRRSMSFAKHKHLWIISIKSSFTPPVCLSLWRVGEMERLDGNVESCVNSQLNKPHENVPSLIRIFIVCRFWLGTNRLWIII